MNKNKDILNFQKQNHHLIQLLRKYLNRHYVEHMHLLKVSVIEKYLNQWKIIEYAILI